MVEEGIQTVIDTKLRHHLETWMKFEGNYSQTIPAKASLFVRIDSQHKT